jgi:DNA-binding winged helix-turn-helix (wHTH) protein/tetratricopeptide (TPR) repeat protein
MLNGDTLQLIFDQFELDERNARLLRNGRPVMLAPKAFAVLCALARQPGQLVTKGLLLDTVWGHQHVSESVLKTVVSDLRAALSDDARQPRYIETVSRRGYRFVSTISLSPAVDRRASANLLSVRDAKSVPELNQRPQLIGRQEAISKLHTAWDKAKSGHRQTVWVTGEAGVGKTTLIDNFAASLGAVISAHGQCVEQFGTGEPYLPIFDALGSLCSNDPSLVTLMRQVAPTWLHQMPWLSNAAERESLRLELAGANQDRMLRELGVLFDRYTQEQPLLLVTEDLHWSDHATVRLIDHIARRRGTARLMWISSFRLAEVIAEDHPLKDLRHELRLHQLCEELLLDSFSESEVADYIVKRLPGNVVSDAFTRSIHTHTDGLPLFVVNVIDDLLSQGILKPGENEPLTNAQISHVNVPENLAGVIEKLVTRLPSELRSLLEAASVCGVEFRTDTVADVLECEADWVVERCDGLARRQNWLNTLSVHLQPDGKTDARFAFRHALYKRVFYQRIGAHTRVRMHGRAAVSLERRRAAGVMVSAAELATHFELSHELMPALRHYADAAQSALRHFAPKETLELTLHALNIIDRVPDSMERDEAELALLSHQGVAASQLHGVASPEARNAFERAQALSDRLPPASAQASELSGQGWVLYARGEFAAALALGKRMLALADTRQEPILRICAYNLMGATAAYQGDIVNATRWMQQGLTLYEQLDDMHASAAFLVDPGVSMRANLFIPLAHQGYVDQARAQLEAAAVLADKVKQPMAQMLVHWCSGIMHSWLGNAELVLQAAEALQSLIAEHALAQAEGPALWLRGWALARLGEPDRGYALIMEGYQRHARFDMLCGGTQVIAYATEALILAARWQDAKTQVEEGLTLARDIGERIYLPDLHMLEARIALGQKRADDARRALHAALTEARSQQARWMELAALAALCELPDATQADFDALNATSANLNEGLDTVLAQRVQRLLTPANHDRAVPSLD